MRPEVIIIQLILCVVGASIATNLAVWPLALISSARNENLEQIDLLCCSALTSHCSVWPGVLILYQAAAVRGSVETIVNNWCCSLTAGYAGGGRRVTPQHSDQLPVRGDVSLPRLGGKEGGGEGVGGCISSWVITWYRYDHTETAPLR